MKSDFALPAAVFVGFGFAGSAPGSPVISVGTVTGSQYNPDNYDPTTGTGQWINCSSIVPPSGDIAVGSTIVSTNYVGNHEAAGGSAGVLVDGQTAAFPSNAGKASLNPNESTNPSNAAFDYQNPLWYVEFELPATASGLGYDISSTEVISGHQDNRTSQDYDLLVSSNGTDFFSLSDGNEYAIGGGGSGFSLYAGGGGAQTTVTPNDGAVLATGVKYFEFVDESSGNDIYRETALYGLETVPEPASLGLIALSGIGLLHRRRRLT